MSHFKLSSNNHLMFTPSGHLSNGCPQIPPPHALVPCNVDCTICEGGSNVYCTNTDLSPYVGKIVKINGHDECYKVLGCASYGSEAVTITAVYDTCEACCTVIPCGNCNFEIGSTCYLEAIVSQCNFTGTGSPYPEYDNIFFGSYNKVAGICNHYSCWTWRGSCHYWHSTTGRVQGYCPGPDNYIGLRAVRVSYDCNTNKWGWSVGNWNDDFVADAMVHSCGGATWSVSEHEDGSFYGDGYKDHLNAGHIIYHAE